MSQGEANQSHAGKWKMGYKLNPGGELWGRAAWCWTGELTAPVPVSVGACGVLHCLCSTGTGDCPHDGGSGGGSHGQGELALPADQAPTPCSLQSATTRVARPL